MKSASQMSLEIRRKKKQMMSEETHRQDPDDIQLEDEDTAADKLDHNRPSPAHGEHSGHHEVEEPMSDDVHMMAEGGEAKRRTVKPDKGYGSITIIEDESPTEAAERRRKERLKKLMSK